MKDKEKTEDTKKRRIKGDAFWKLKSFEKKIKKFRDDITEWQSAAAEELKLYPDQINWGTGQIIDPLAEVKDGRVINGQVIGRIPFDLLREHKTKMEEIEDIIKEMEEFQNSLAERLRIWPDMINLQDGIVKDNEYDPIDPDNMPPEDEEPEAEPEDGIELEPEPQAEDN